MFLCLARDLNLVSPSVEAGIYSSLFDVEDPKGKGTVEDGVDGYCDCCIEFCVVETKLVVPVEGGGADSKGTVAEG